MEHCCFSLSQDTLNMWFHLSCLFIYLSSLPFFFSLWHNYGVVRCVTLILRFLLQFVTLLQVPAIITWFFFIRGGCVYLCLLRESMVSTLDLFPLMSQGWLWSSWSFFITVSLLSGQHLNTLTSLDRAFFFFNSAWVQVSSSGHSWIEPKQLEMWQFQAVQPDLLESAPYKMQVLYHCCLQPDVWRWLQMRAGLAWTHWQMCCNDSRITLCVFLLSLL